MSIQFDEIQFPAKISYGCAGGPRYKTTIVRSDSGYEQRFIHWDSPLREYTLTLDPKNQREHDKLLDFAKAREGCARAFRYKDWSDFKSDQQTLVNLGTTQLQLIKTYGDSANTLTRKIIKPVVNTVTINVDGTWLPLSGYTVNTTTGIVTMATTHPGSTIKWSGQFDVPCRFADDSWISQIDGFQMYSISNIKMVEVRI